MPLPILRLFARALVRPMPRSDLGTGEYMAGNWTLGIFAGGNTQREAVANARKVAVVYLALRTDWRDLADALHERVRYALDH